MNLRVETGSCFCGTVAAEISGEPFWICYDHDDDCRRAIGSPLNIWVGYRPEQFRLVRGMPKPFSKTKGVTRSFCGDCGTSISYKDERRPKGRVVSHRRLFFRSPGRISSSGPRATGVRNYRGLILPIVCPASRHIPGGGMSRLAIPLSADVCVQNAIFQLPIADSRVRPHRVETRI